MEEKEYEFKSFKEKQAHFKRRCEERGKFVSISKYDYEYKSNGKGRTYKKSKRRILKDEGGNV